MYVLNRVIVGWYDTVDVGRIGIPQTAAVAVSSDETSLKAEANEMNLKRTPEEVKDGVFYEVHPESIRVV